MLRLGHRFLHSLHIPLRMTRLSNGLKVVSQFRAGESATVGMSVRAGSRYENDMNNGVAHFLEHTVFKGSEKRSERVLEKEAESMGAQLNAFTSRDMTAYFVRLMGKDAAWGVDVVTDILSKPLLSKTALDRERNVILAEATEVDHQYREVIFDVLHENVFSGESLARTVLGPASNIQSMTREQIREYLNKYYIPRRMVFGACGPIAHEKLVDWVAESFGTSVAGEINVGSEETTIDAHRLLKEEEETTGICHFRGGIDARVARPDTPFAHVLLAVEGPTHSSPDFVVFEILRTLIGSYDTQGGSMDGIMSPFLRPYVADGLADGILPFVVPYRETGVFGLYLYGNPSSVREMVSKMYKDWMGLCLSITEDELQRVKSRVKSMYLLSLEDTMLTWESFGRQITTIGRSVPPHEWFARLDAVDLEHVQSVADRYFHPDRMSMAVMGQIANVPSLQELVKS
uniref:Mitochondrial processing peptidase B subunit n=1 Tax=Stygiella incarcerata TaxID=1712417 RepID=A0A192ZJ85_9EUKA|nr:mitochondrial processing peptidase B subunit [Stygiella incarcerata]|eukprot:TRINITY_DN5209_c0_g1_i1.p1 TRINITY_DN5209_c0_g1~~TRINITY_DN5209_c0_g1_i1.p1  ORF type:complete len:459 (+),score=121.45 TRINITY_DN5209_c0_g1_i1:111-1487(+)